MLNPSNGAQETEKYQKLHALKFQLKKNKQF